MDKDQALNAEQTIEEQDLTSIEKEELLLRYTTKFINEGKRGAEFYCFGWNGINNIYFRSKQPEDLIFKVLEGINEGRRICYIESYKHFTGSVYYHLRNELKTYFKSRKKDDITEDKPENLFTVEDAENFFENGAYTDGAEEILKGLENNELREKLFSLFDPAKEADEVAVLNEILTGWKREEIAENLNFTAAKVTNIQKRIYRKIHKNF